MSSNIEQSSYLNICVGRRTIKSLVDTGSFYSLISSSVIERLGISYEPVQQNSLNLYAAQGSKLNILGNVILPFKVSGILFHNNFHIVDNLSESVIFGTEFLQSHACILDYSKQLISFWGDLARAPLHSDTKDLFVKTTQVITVRPYSETIIRVSCPHRFNNKDVKLDPIPGSQFHRYAVARSVCNVTNNSTVCRILNFKDECLVLPRNTKIAIINNVNVDRDYSVLATPSDDSDSDNNYDDDSFPTPSSDQLERFVSDYGFRINSDLSSDQRTDLMTVLYRYRSVFARSISELKQNPNYELKLQLKKDAKTFYRRQYKLSSQDVDECHKQIEDLRKNGLIEPSHNSLYNNALFLVNKGHGSTERRLVLDMRNLNNIVEPFNLELPEMSSLLNDLAATGANYFSSCDLRSSFWQVSLHPESRHLTSFTDPKSKQRFQWRVTPFGLANSVGATIIAIFESLSKLISQNMVFVYLDDVCLASTTFSEHIDRLKLLLKTMKLNQLSLNPKKTTLAFDNIEFLGYNVSKNGLRISDERIKILRNLPPPKDRKSLLRTISMLGFLRRHIPSFTTRTYHMRQNLIKDHKFEWTKECQDEFTYLLSWLTSDNVLRPIDPRKEFHVFTDGSYKGTSWVVCQIYDGKMSPVLYSGKALSKHQRNFSVLQVEMLAVYFCMQQIAHYVGTQTVHLYSDNLSLVYLKGISLGNLREQRLAAYLLNFRLVLHHIPSKANGLADNLSRCFEDMPPGQLVEFLPTEADDDMNFLFAINPDYAESDDNDSERVEIGTTPEPESPTHTDTQSSDKEYCYHTVQFSNSAQVNHIFQLHDQIREQYTQSHPRATITDTPADQTQIQTTPITHSTLRPEAKEFVISACRSNLNLGTIPTTGSDSDHTCLPDSNQSNHSSLMPPTSLSVTHQFPPFTAHSDCPEALISPHVQNSTSGDCLYKHFTSYPPPITTQPRSTRPVVSTPFFEMPITATPATQTTVQTTDSAASTPVSLHDTARTTQTGTFHDQYNLNLNVTSSPNPPLPQANHSNHSPLLPSPYPDTVMAVTRRGSNDNHSPITDAVDNVPAGTSTTPVEFHVDHQDATSTANTQNQQSSTQTDNKYLTYIPSISPSDYKDDLEFSAMYCYLADGTLTGDYKTDKLLILLSEDFMIDTDKLLYRITIPRKKNSPTAAIVYKRLCLPATHRDHTFKICHDLLSHPARDRLFLAMKTRFYYKNLYNDCIQYSNTCSDCLQNKRNYKHVTRPLNPLEPATYVGQRWHLDHLVLKRPTSDGDVSILVIVDSYSKYPLIRAVKSETSLETAKVFLSSVVSTFGLSPTTTIVTDRGRSFCSNFFRHLTHMLGIRQVTSATSAARTNGAAELVVKATKDSLKFYADSDLSLSAAIPIVELGLRSSVNSSHGFSPFELIHGYPMPVPVINNANVPHQFSSDYKAYLHTIVERLAALKEVALANLKKTAAQNELQYNRRNKVQPVTFQLGDRVLIESKRVKDQTKNLTKNRFEPGYVITDIVQGPGIGPAYQLTSVANGRVLKTLIAHDRLKKDTSEKRQDFNMRNPVLPDPMVSTDTVDPAQSPATDASTGNDNRPTTTTTPKRRPTRKTDNNDNNGMCPAVRVLRQKGTGNSKQYYVLFTNGEKSWCKDLTPALLNSWLVKRSEQIARRRRKRRTRY